VWEGKKQGGGGRAKKRGKRVSAGKTVCKRNPSRHERKKLSKEKGGNFKNYAAQR